MTASYPGLTPVTVVFTISPATPTVKVADAGGTYKGMAFAATATVAGVVPGVDNTPASTLEGVGLTLDYEQLAGNGTVVADLGAVAPVAAGSYEVTASFAGSPDYMAASASTTFTISPARAEHLHRQ